MFLSFYIIFNLLLIPTMVVCKTTTTTQSPQNGSSMAAETIVQKSVKIINSCDVGTTNINYDTSAENNCIYEQSSNGLCFHFGKKTSTYKEASEQCGKNGMELASITKPQILDLLARMTNKRNASKNTFFWINVPDSTWDSMGNWSTYYKKYYNGCDGKYKKDSEEKTCPFLMSKASTGNTKAVLRKMKDAEDCVLKLDLFCQENVTRPMTKQTLPMPSVVDDVNPPTVAIIAASSVGMLVLLIIVGLIIRSLLKARIHSHDRMENTKSDTSEIEEKRSEERYSIAKDSAYDALNNTNTDEYADYAELDDEDFKVEKQTNDKLNDVDKILPASPCDNAGNDSEEPCYFVLNKESSTESLQHTYEDCAFKDVPSTSSLQMVSNPLTLTLPVVRQTEETDENVYDWPDLLQPTNYSAKTRRTQSETEPQYFSLEIEDNYASENIYDCVFPVDEPLKKSPKPSRTKHLSLQRKKHKTKQNKGRFSDVTRK